MNEGGKLKCSVCGTEHEDKRLKPPHHGGITKIPCSKCQRTTIHHVEVPQEAEPAKVA